MLSFFKRACSLGATDACETYGTLYAGNVESKSFSVQRAALEESKRELALQTPRYEVADRSFSTSAPRVTAANAAIAVTSTGGSWNREETFLAFRDKVQFLDFQTMERAKVGDLNEASFHFECFFPIAELHSHVELEASMLKLGMRIEC